MPIGAGLAAEQAIVRHERVPDVDQPGFGGADAFLVQLADIEARVRQLDDEQTDGIGRMPRPGARGEHQEVGYRRVGDVELGAVEAPAAGDLVRLRLHAAHVRAAVGLRESKAADLLAGETRPEEARLLVRRAGAPYRPQSEVGVRRPGRGKGLTHPAQLLANDAVADLVEPGAAIGLRIAHAEQPEFSPFAEQLAGKHLGLLGLRNQRRDLLGHETGDGLTHLLVLGRELEIHAAPLDDMSRAAQPGCHLERANRAGPSIWRCDHRGFVGWYSWVGSNHRPPVPQTGALTN